MASQPLPRQKRARLILALGLVALGVWIIHDFLASLVWAAVIAIAISPLYERAERRWPHLRGGAILPAITTLVVALLVLVPVSLGIIRAASEAQDIVRWITTARESGIPVPHWLYSIPFGRDAAVNWWQQHLATPEATQAELARFNNRALLYHTQIVGKGLIHRSIIFLFTLLALFFLLRDADMLVGQIKSAGYRLFGPSGERMGRQVVQSVRGTIDGLVLVGIGEGAVMAVAYLALGVPHPLLLGAATAIAAMIPFGAAVMFEIAAFALLTQDAVTAAILVNVIGFTVVGIADHFLRPALIGGATRLPFLWVLVGILGGVETLGLLGLFVGPATMAVLVMLWREYVERDLPPPDTDVG
ncbi:AI-2E family transporter [Sphingomonas sp. PR090111-T3T-6A]|uniref:AI-2E family transporter n=1 Tax=Sphingomonas sp. PR090111-T3T-6A TaxID=685778 RepID=UPI00035E7118|nr:AI-2E family transporter [Sphingomonas sp. PR090111-T3T-6A]